MKSKNKLVVVALALSVAAGGVLACSEQGALEKAGAKVDETLDDLTHPGEGPIEEAARKVGDKVDEAKEKVKAKLSE